jgi:hypothetical protein
MSIRVFSSSLQSSRPRATHQIVTTLLLSLLLFAVAGKMPAFAQSGDQKPQTPDAQKPFIEPAEMKHDRAALRLFIEAAPQTNGRWDTLPLLMPINPVHVALMHNGKVLVIAGSGNDPDNKTLEAAVWQPGPDTVRTFRIDWDMFCNGMVIMPNGQPFVLGGTLKYDNFLGYRKTANVQSSDGEIYQHAGHERRALVSHGNDAGRWHGDGAFRPERYQRRSEYDGTDFQSRCVDPGRDGFPRAAALSA